ncbi:hypothetical protein [Acidomonas methanolica]|uniref:hypothetical protein n=1 Tax=Acidomonas methanolica TaxID=437 RepID=UPI002119DA2E|nr:hypothetical protein [Acidomonas methanolica]MCQ9156120.1 hypothetical protein [Acidomonas methanolica]
MIVKSARMKTSAQGISSTCRHVFHGSDNEKITVLQGSEFDVKAELGRAKAVGSQYAVRHIKVSSYEDMTDEQLFSLVIKYAREFKADPSSATIVRHDKHRADGKASSHHYHIYFPEVLANGKIMDSSFSKIREEKIARIAEIDFGHKPILGKHNASVIKDLEKSGQKYYADIIRQNTPSLDPKDSPDASYSDKQFRRAKISGIALNEVRQTLKELRINSESFGQMIESLDAHGMEIRKGDKANTYIIVNNENGSILGSANRLFNMKKADFNQQYESYLNGHDTKCEPLEASVAIPSAENTPAQPASEPSTPIPSSHQDNAPSTQIQASQSRPTSKPAGHWLGSTPISINSEKSVATEGMTQQERQAVHDFNERESQKDQQIREFLLDQKKFAELLIKMEQELSALIRKRYQALPREPFANPELRDAEHISQSLHETLDPLRDAYLRKKSRWLSSSKQELRAFNEKMKELRFKEFKGLDIYNNQREYDYVINNMSDLYASSRQRRHNEWSNNLDVINYVNHKKDIDKLISHIKEHKDVGLLQLAIKSPLLALDRIKINKGENNNKTDIANTAISNKLWLDKYLVKYIGSENAEKAYAELRTALK